MEDGFGKLIAILIDGEWATVENAREALLLLQSGWPDISGASYHRAIASSQAFLSGEGSMLGASASFAVAAMEAGLRWELYDDHLSFAEAQVEALVIEDMRRENDGQTPGEDVLVNSGRT